MREPLWQRVRRRKNTADAKRPVSTDHRARPVATEGAAGNDDQMLPLLGDLDQGGGKKAEYAEWVERMKVKRAEKVDTVRELSGDEPGSERPSYWSSDAVWEESRRLEEEGASVVVTRQELLAVLGLGADATPDDVVAMYRRKAKEHHPDRFPDADDSTRSSHVEQMQRISAAYRALQPDQRA